MKDYNPNEAVDFLLVNAGKFAQAKAERIYLEEFRKSKKAILMKEAEMNGITAVNGQEREAYANKEYKELITALSAGVEVEEKLKWQMLGAQLRVDIWRTEQANNRLIERSTV